MCAKRYTRVMASPEIPAAPSVYQHIRNTLEIIYFLCSPIVIVTVVLGLRQLNAIKEQTGASRRIAETNAKREAFRLAVEQGNVFAEKIIPQMNKVMENLADDVHNTLVKIRLDVNHSDKKVKIIYPKDANSAPSFTSEGLLETLNSFEGFSSYFCSGVAAESVAFSALGRAYCSFVRLFMPIIIRENNKEQLWMNTLSLFFIWDARIQNQNLATQKEELERKILQSQNQSEITPIGMNP
jgi:hypothetical protein